MNNPHGFCSIAYCAMRESPSHRSEMVNQVLFGETYQIIEQQTSWSQIRTTHDQYEGWIPNGQVHIDESRLSEKYCLIQPIYARPRNIMLSIGSYVNTELCPLLDEADCCATQQHVNNLSSLFHIANSYFLDAPYLWGGRTVWGIDCSGLVQILFRTIGVPLPRDASQQVAMGIPIDYKDRQVGDVAFFTATPESDKIIHVGIVANNPKQILHASHYVRYDHLTTKGILNEQEQYSHYLHSIRRLLSTT